MQTPSDLQTLRAMAERCDPNGMFELDPNRWGWAWHHSEWMKQTAWGPLLYRLTDHGVAALGLPRMESRGHPSE